MTPEETTFAKRIIAAMSPCLTSGQKICAHDWCNVPRATAAMSALGPLEPPGLGAVVEDADGQLWIRTEPVGGEVTPWVASWSGRTDDNQPAEYVDIDVVKVLSEGIS